jgi:hypothetical protein
MDVRGTWTEDEEPAEESGTTHGGKDWGHCCLRWFRRTEKQCRDRWHNTFPAIALTAGRTGKWAEDEDSNLKSWYKRTVVRISRNCCAGSWSNEKTHEMAISHDPSIDETNGRRNGQQTKKSGLREFGTSAQWQGLGRNCLLVPGLFEKTGVTPRR